MIMPSNPQIDKGGTKRWYNSVKQLHRTDGPAVECANDSKSWYLNGQLHRTDGPAIEYVDGSKHWYLNGQLYTNPTKSQLSQSPYDLGELVRHNNKVGLIIQTDNHAKYAQLVMFFDQASTTNTKQWIFKWKLKKVSP